MKKNGIALLTVVIFLFVMSIMGIAFLSIINIDLREVDTQLQDMQAFYMAEAGLQKAVWYLNQGKQPPEEESFGIGSYKVRLLSVQDGLKILSKGCAGSTEVMVEMDAQKVQERYYLIPGTWKQKYSGET